MVEIILTELAWDDLDTITDFIAQDSIRYAQEFSDQVFERIEGLKAHPRMGRKVPSYNNEDFRELILNDYRIMYRIYSATEIIILRIIHGAQDYL